MKEFSLSRSRPAYHLLLLAIVSVAVFSSTLGHDFITTWDDDKYVTDNPIIRGFSAQNIRAAFSTFCLGNYAPLHLISYMPDYTLFGLNPMGYHLHNIILHTLNGILVWLLIRKIDGNTTISFIAAFIFLVHPVQVETVAWISQRKTILCMLFFLLSFHSYVCARETGRIKLYWMSVVLFGMALLSKSVAVFLPFLLLAYDLLKTERRDRWLLLDKIPFAALALLFSIVAMISQMPEEGGGRSGYYGGSPYATALTMLPVFCRYLINLVWPVRLSADYLVPVKTSVDPEVALCAALLAVLLVTAGYAATRNRGTGFWLLAALLAILPVSQIVPIVTLMNDRYLYFPLLGIAPLVAGTIVNLAARGRPARLVALTLAAYLLAFPWLSFERSRVWSNGKTLWQDVLDSSPDNYIAMTSLGDSFREAGDKEEALRLYRRALYHNRDYFVALNNVSNLLLQTDRLDEAEGFIMRLIRQYPRYAKGFEMLGIMKEFSGKTDEAESAYIQALKLDPDLGESLISLAAIMVRKGNRGSAEQLLARAQKLSGDSPELYYSMACLDAQSGQVPRAFLHLERAVRSGIVDITMAIDDPCFAPLRGDPRFARLMGIVANQRSADR